MREKNISILVEILQAILTNSLSQKERIENKVIGYITFISLSESVIVTLLSYILSNYECKKVYFPLFLFIMFIGVVYWSTLSIITALIAVKPRTIRYLDANVVIIAALGEKAGNFESDLVASCAHYINKNNEVGKIVSRYSQLTYVFTVLASIFFVLFLIFFILYVIL